jgi:hypothetical protein
MIAEVSGLKPEQEQLLHAAARWRLLGLLYEYPSGDWRKHVVALSAEIADPGLRQAAQTVLEEASEGSYQYFFGPGGPVPLREVSYTAGIQPGYLLSELEARYHAFAYHPKGPDPGDHLSVEIGYVSYLFMKEAYALACGIKEQASLAAEARVHFIRDHLSHMAEPISQRLGEVVPHYLSQAGRLLLEWVGPPLQSPESIHPNPHWDDNEGWNCSSLAPPSGDESGI